jgi:ApaG protein
MHDPRYLVDVSVVTRYLPEQSQPEHQRFAFAYTVTVKQQRLRWPPSCCRATGSSPTATAMSRKSAAQGCHRLQQPLIDQLAASHTYSSGTVITTKVGTMQGSYQMHAEDGKRLRRHHRPLPPRGTGSPALMATYAVGDLQGCLEPLKCLLDRVAFDPAQDQVSGWWATWSTAAPQSLETLRFLYRMRDVPGVRAGQP